MGQISRMHGSKLGHKYLGALGALCTLMQCAGFSLIFSITSKWSRAKQVHLAGIRWKIRQLQSSTALCKSCVIRQQIFTFTSVTAVLDVCLQAMSCISECVLLQEYVLLQPYWLKIAGQKVSQPT